ncbi:hypothetical protein HZH66_002032 [Vespula vulgaris]|uniref:Uncharacterized protein n=1 Tax=Vespula vulgaris TaxID=7454 RepID=A0A834NFU9_VESVU|nr:hypothetical protein HZH66_002032 [Vespula vulgaris]
MAGNDSQSCLIGAICNLVSPKTKNHNNLHIGTIICYTFQFCLHNEKIGYIRVATGFNRLIRYGIENEHCWIVHYQYYSSYGVSFTQHTYSMKATSNNVGLVKFLPRLLLVKILSEKLENIAVKISKKYEVKTHIVKADLTKNLRY